MASLYIGNLGPDCTEALLYQKFAPVGNLLNIRLCKDKATGHCLGYGFINYASKSDAQKALSTLNYTLFQNRTTRLMWAEKDIKKLPSSANIFIKNLVPDIDEKALHDIFSNYGNILSLKLATDENGTSKGFAFIQYQEEHSAEDAIKEVNEKMLRGKVVYVNKFMPRDKRMPLNALQFQNVYIKNFDSYIKDTDLIKMCSKFGDIISAKVMLDEEGNSKCFGFVSFKSAESAREAVRELNGKPFNGRRLFADRAKRKTEREKEVLESFRHRFQDIERNNIKSV